MLRGCRWLEPPRGTQPGGDTAPADAGRWLEITCAYETADRAVTGWLPTGPAEPFFDSALLSLWRPRTDSNRRRQP